MLNDVHVLNKFEKCCQAKQKISVMIFVVQWYSQDNSPKSNAERPPKY